MGDEQHETLFFYVAKPGGSDSLQIRQTVVRVRIPLSPPSSLPSQRLRAHSREQSEKTPRFRGVLAVEPSRIRTGDGEFGASNAQECRLFSVAKLGGPDSLSTRLGVQSAAADQQQLASIDPGCRLAAYSGVRIGLGQRCCWPLNTSQIIPLSERHRLKRRAKSSTWTAQSSARNGSEVPSSTIEGQHDRGPTSGTGRAETSKSFRGLT
jgi:hypothetical protein